MDETPKDPWTKRLEALRETVTLCEKALQEIQQKQQQVIMQRMACLGAIAEIEAGVKDAAPTVAPEGAPTAA